MLLCNLSLASLAFLCILHTTSAQKRFLRAAAADVPPYDLVITLPNGTQRAEGVSPSAVDWLSRKLNFSFEYVFATPGNVKERGYEAPIDLVANGEADFTTTGFAITPARYPRLDLSTAQNWEEGYRMVVPRPGEQDRLFAFIKPFDVNVWALTAVSFIVVSLVMGLLTWLGRDYELRARRQQTIGDSLGTYFLYNVNVLTNHGDYLKVPNASFLIAVTYWLLGAAVLVYGYSSIVVSSITVPQMKPTINSFEDVVAHPEVSLIVRTDTYIGYAINASTDNSLYKALREKAQKRPGSIGNEGVINSTKLLLTGQYTYVFLDTAVRFFVANQYLRERKCSFKMSKRLSLSNSYFYQLFTKGHKLLAREFSIASIRLWETGILRQFMKTIPWLPKADQCFASDSSFLKSTSNQSKSIKLVDLTSAFFILGVGAGSSLLAFMVEFTIRCRKRNARQHRLTSRS